LGIHDAGEVGYYERVKTAKGVKVAREMKAIER
jgi:hypothetical protein